MIKRAVLAVIGGVVLLVAGLAVIVVPAFAGLKPVVDGAELPGGIVQLKDMSGSYFLLPIAEGEVALVDCGMDPKASAAMSALEKRHLQPSAVKYVLLTHGHPDHVGGCAAFPNAQVMALEQEVPYATGAAHAKSLVAKLLPDPGHYTKVGRALHDGETVALGPVNAKVYSVPGHTPGSAAYLINGVLFVGDVAVAKADGTVRDSAWFFSDDAAKNRASTVALAKRLVAEKADVKTLAFAHSGPLSGLEPLTHYAP